MIVLRAFRALHVYSSIDTLFINHIGCTLSLEIGPRNITRMEGQNNIFIPCPYYTSLPVWKINKITYTVSNFRDLPYLQAFPQGLMIKNLTKDMNNTKFQCFHHDAESTIGILKVLTREDYYQDHIPP